MLLSKNSYKSVKSSITKLKPKILTISFILGNTLRELLSWSKSLALALPNDTLPANLSRS